MDIIINICHKNACVTNQLYKLTVISNEHNNYEYPILAK